MALVALAYFVFTAFCGIAVGYGIHRPKTRFDHISIVGVAVGGASVVTLLIFR